MDASLNRMHLTATLSPFQRPSYTTANAPRPMTCTSCSRRTAAASSAVCTGPLPHEVSEPGCPEERERGCVGPTAPAALAAALVDPVPGPDDEGGPEVVVVGPDTRALDAAIEPDTPLASCASLSRRWKWEIICLISRCRPSMSSPVEGSERGREPDPSVPPLPLSFCACAAARRRAAFWRAFSTAAACAASWLAVAVLRPELPVVAVAAVAVVLPLPDLGGSQLRVVSIWEVDEAEVWDALEESSTCTSLMLGTARAVLPEAVSPTLGDGD
mmetsp:Transcript_36241/g.91534  ORF Transcript_36241/g.91534 Transcript_36241/m.91534 type:complete len:272 (+) Transcript_36241:365-1180(+)